MKGITEDEYVSYVEKSRRQRDKMRLLLIEIDKKRDLIFKEPNSLPAG